MALLVPGGGLGVDGSPVRNLLHSLTRQTPGPTLAAQQQSALFIQDVYYVTEG